MEICKICGRPISEYDMQFVVNPGLPTEYVECELCHDASCDSGRVVRCKACGNYYSADAIRSEDIHGHNFAPCPHCGKDVVDGLTRDEFLDDLYIPKYAVIVQFANGTSRGYAIAADNADDLMKRILDKVSMAGVTAIHMSEILLDEDVML